MKKLFKKLRLKLNLFTRKELSEFSKKMLYKNGYNVTKEVSICHSDVENFIHDLKNN